jgi:hypothetical protein
MNQRNLAQLAVAALLFACSGANADEPRPGPARIALDPSLPPIAPERFLVLDGESRLSEFVARLGAPHHETRLKDLCVLVWRVTEERELWVGTGHCGRDERPGYVRFREVIALPSGAPLSPNQLHGVDEKLTLREIVARIGQPHAEAGSGLCIFVWRVNDGREFWVATAYCSPAEHPVYAKLMAGPRS